MPQFDASAEAIPLARTIPSGRESTKSATLQDGLLELRPRPLLERLPEIGLVADVNATLPEWTSRCSSSR